MTPTIQPVKIESFEIRKKVENKAKEVIEPDSREKVEELSECISSQAVIVPKEDGDIKCFDMKQAGKGYSKRTTHATHYR